MIKSGDDEEENPELSALPLEECSGWKFLQKLFRHREADLRVGLF